MSDLTRRSLAAGAGLLVGAFVSAARAQQQIASIATAPKVAVKPFTFNPDKVQGLSAELLRDHHAREYGETVKKLNALNEELVHVDFAEADPGKIGNLKRDQHAAYNATILHELYFDGLSEAPSQPAGLLAQALSRDFGSLERWQAEFAATAKSLDRGSGWVTLAYSPRDKRLFNHWAEDDAMAPAGGTPLLAIDMYEHAYAADYGKDGPKYIDAFMKAIKWTNAERLYREAMRV